MLVLGPLFLLWVRLRPLRVEGRSVAARMGGDSRAAGTERGRAAAR